MTNKTLKKIIITTSILLLVFAAGTSYQNLVYNCDTKAVDFGLGSGKIENKGMKEANIAIDFSVTESTLENSKLQERNMSYQNGNAFQNLIENYTLSDCTLDILRTPNLELKINVDKNKIQTSPLFIDKYQPLKIDFFGQKRIYDFATRAKKEVETMLADYKIYKYDKVWVFQNDMPSREKDRTPSYQKNTLGKFLSFDQGQNWLYINREFFPETIFKDFLIDKSKPNNSSIIRQDKFKYQVSKNFENETVINYLYEVVEEKEELRSSSNVYAKDVFIRIEENDTTRYFILDAGLVGTYKDEKSNQEIPVYWYQIQSLDGKNKLKVYTTSRTDSFSGQSLELIKQKLLLQI